MKSNIDLDYIFVAIVLALLSWSIIIVLTDVVKDVNKKKEVKIETSIKLIMEEAYFEGQRDALEGDIRLLQVKDTLNDSVKWVWVKSPWDDGTPPVFKP